MARVSPMSIRKGCPDFREASSHGLTAGVAGATNIWACRSFENAIVGHETHEGIDIMTIPCIGESLQKRWTNLGQHIRHD